METFSVELHSSASSKLYPQNEVASFTIFLPDQINLESEWEVALTENCFPSKFFNFTEGSFEISVAKGVKVIDSKKIQIFARLLPNKKIYCLLNIRKGIRGLAFKQLPQNGIQTS